MKIGLAVATADSPSSAFVALRGNLSECVDQCAAMGFDGVELALRDATQVDLPQLQRHLRATGMEVPCLSTGQVFAVDHLSFTHPEAQIRRRAMDRVLQVIELASELGSMVNMGRVRGRLIEGDEMASRQRCLDCIAHCADAAELLGVDLIIEPVNRYELNFVNSCAEGADLIRESGRQCLRLMPDTFHMNIEDASFHQALTDNGTLIGYVHVADSNRLAPGWGHLSFDVIFSTLQAIGYDDWVTAEILPRPNPHDAAIQALHFLRSRLAAGAHSSL